MKKEQQVFERCRQFIKDNKISCAETIYQCEWVEENALEFIEDIAELVGYHEEKT